MSHQAILPKFFSCKYYTNGKPLTTFFLILFLILSSKIAAQPKGWITGNFYQYQGGEDISCGSVYTVRNPYNGFLEDWQKCRKRKWYQEYYSGYVYLWGPSGWYTQWQEGTFWAFNWYDYDYRVR